MSSTPMTTANPLTVKLWEKKVWVQMMQRAVVGHAFNRGAVYFPEKLMGAQSVGDNITFPYVGKLTGIPIGEGGTADGNEEALETQSHSMSMNVSRIPVLNPNTDTIEQQRTTVQFEQQTRTLIGRRALELLDTSFFYQAAGANPTSLTINGTTYSNAADLLHVTGQNVPTAPTANRYVIANSEANDQSINSADTFRMDFIDYALEKNERTDQPIEPFEDGTFDLFVSPEQLVDIQQDSNGKIQWFNIELAKITGGYMDESYLTQRFKNGIICAGRYRNVNIYMAPRVAYGVNSGTSAVITTVRRAIMLGQDALSFASPFGGRITDKDTPLKFFTQLKDYDYYKGIEGRLLYGMKKMAPSNKDDTGVMVLSTYAAPHA